MPQRTTQSGPELSITLDSDRPFLGGDTISGHVARSAHFVDSDASVIIRLYARSKLKIDFSGGMTRQVFRSRFNLFGSSGQAYKLHAGPVHIPPGLDEGRWPFAITLPKCPVPASRNDLNPKEQPSYLSLNDVGSHSLPATFSYRGTRTGTLIQAHVEYYLEATLQGNSSGKQFAAVMPVQVGPVVSPTPITDFDIERRADYEQTVASYHLLPSTESTRLSLGQKTRKLLGSSHVPRFSFRLEFSVPTVLQVNSPNTIPFQIQVIPNWDRTTEALKEAPPVVSVNKINLVLHTTFRCIIRGNMKRTPEIKLHSSFTWASYSRRQIAAVSRASETQEGRKDQLAVPIQPASLDLGKTIGFKWPRNSARTGVYPTFTTYNTRIGHRLACELGLTVAGQDIVSKLEWPVTIIGPSHEHI